MRALLLLSFSLILGCVPQSESGRYEVVARLGEEPTAAPGARRATHVKLGESTRYAIEVAPDAAFELSVDGSVRRVHFSIAGLGGRPGRVRFSLQQKAILGWDTVFSEVVDDDEWRDRRAEVAGRVWGRQRGSAS